MTAKQDQAGSQLFLSCDLTGSTNFKQRRDLAEPWQKVFLQFYREFPQRVAMTQVALETQNLDFALWKPVGDELIYSCPVSSETDVYRAVRTWTKAMLDYEKFHLDDTQMGTKGGAFIATFPGPDSRSSVPRRPDQEESDDDVINLNRQAHKRYAPSKYLYDYFGPSIDTGFRVLSRCTPRHFTLSVEVALAMLGVVLAPGSGHDAEMVQDFLLLEFVELKGVWGGKRYPIVAIDTRHDDPVNRAYAKFEQRGQPSDILALCEACYRTDNWPSKLYLPGSGNKLLATPPEDPLSGHVATTSVGAEVLADELDDPKALDEDAPLGLIDEYEVVEGYVHGTDSRIHGLMPNGTALCGAVGDDNSGPYISIEEPPTFSPITNGACRECAGIWDELFS